MAIEKKRVINIETGNSQRNVQTLKQQIKELRDSMGMMEQGTVEWEKASVKLSNALQKQREIAEAGTFTNQDYGNKLANIGKVGAGVTAGINGLTNALSLMGVQIGKDDTAMIKFTTSMMAVVQGLASLDTASKAWKGLVTGFNAALDARLKDTAATAANTVTTNANTAAKTENTAATAANTAATGGATVATNGLSTAFTKLAAALRLSKAALGAIGIALAAVGAAIALFVKNMRETREEEQRLNDELAQTTTRMAEADNSAVSAVVSYTKLRASFVQARESGEQLNKWIKDNRSELDKLGISTDNVNELENIFIDNTEAFVKALTERYKAEWALNAIGKEYEKQLIRRNTYEAALKNGPNADGLYMWQDENGMTRTAHAEVIQTNLNHINKTLIELDDKMGQAVATSVENNENFRLFFTETKTNQQQQKATASADRFNQEQLIRNSYTLNRDLVDTLQAFIGGFQRDIVEEFVNNVYKFGISNPLIYQLYSNQLKGLIDSYNEGTDKFKGQYAKLMRSYTSLLTDFNNAINDGDTNLDTFIGRLTALASTIGEKAGNIMSGNWALGIDNIFDLNQILELTSQISDIENKINTINNDTAALRVKNEARRKEITSELTRLRNELLEEEKRVAARVEERNKLENEPPQGNWVKETLNKTYEAVILGIQETYKDERGKIRKQIAELEAELALPENSEDVRAGRLAALQEEYDELFKQKKLIEEIIKMQQEAEANGVSTLMRFRADLGQMMFDTMERSGNDLKSILDSRIDFERETIELLKKNRDNKAKTDAERLAAEQEIYRTEQKIFDLTKQRQELIYKEGAERLANLQAELRQSYDRAIGDMDVYNKGWARLGSSDWNDPTARLDAERMMLHARFDLAEQYRQQNLISEKDYLDQLKQYQADMHSWQIDMMTATAQRRLDILNTSFDAVRSIVSSVNGLLSETMAGEEQNSTRYKQLRIAQTIASGSVASIEALRSGIQSPIPAPGNYALGLGLMGSTIAQTIMAVGNIRNESLNGNTSAGLTSGALNIGSNVYETLAYETNSEISSNIRDSRVYVVESDINQTGNRVYVAESEATW